MLVCRLYSTAGIVTGHDSLTNVERSSAVADCISLGYATAIQQSGVGQHVGAVNDGIALEGALKLLEVAKLYMAIGYEQEDGLHGPCLGFVKGDVVIALSDGVRDRELAHSVVRFSKNELGQGYIFGCDVEDETDLEFNICSDNFKALEAEGFNFISVGADVVALMSYFDNIVKTLS